MVRAVILRCPLWGCDDESPLGGRVFVGRMPAGYTRVATVLRIEPCGTFAAEG
jgi:hypothetical protein